MSPEEIIFEVRALWVELDYAQDPLTPEYWDALWSRWIGSKLIDQQPVIWEGKISNAICQLNLWQINTAWLRDWIKTLAAQASSIRDDAFVDTMMRGFYIRVSQTCKNDEEFRKFEHRIWLLRPQRNRVNPYWDLAIHDVLLALWDNPPASTVLKQEVLEELKYLSIENGSHGHRSPAWPRDSVEPCDHSSHCRGSDECHYGQLRTTDELLESCRQDFRGTDDPVIKSEKLRDSASPFIKEEACETQSLPV